MYSSFFVKNKLSVPKRDSFAYVIPKMVKTAEQIAAGREDLVFTYPKNNEFHMDEPSTISFRFGRDRKTYNLLPFSRQQLCKKIGLPPVYFDRLVRSRNPQLHALACMNVNALLNEHTGEMFIRTVDDCVRGVLSPKYRTFDSDEILDVFTSCVGPDKGLQPDNMVIRGYLASLDVFHLRFTTAKPVRTNTDEDLYYGLDITSSDVGKYALTVRFFVYKRVCTNGMCLCQFDNDLYSQPHIGITKDHFFKGLQRSLTSFPILVAKATDIINSAGDYGLYDSPLFNLENNTPESLRYIEAMERYLGIGQDSMGVIAKLAREKYGTTLWSYCNAITEWAQRYEFERRKELEVKAGRLMTDFDRVMAG